MTLYKRLTSVVLIIALAVWLVYSGVRHDKRLEEDAINESLDTVQTVYFWYTDDSLTDYLTRAAVAFHDVNDSVRVIPELVSANEYLERINEASLEGAQFPDAYMLKNDSLEKAYMAGLASAVENYSNVVNVVHFPNAAINAVTYKNHIVAYPLYFETSVLAYNKNYLEKWAEQKNAGIKNSSETEDSEDIDWSEVTDPEAIAQHEAELAKGGTDSTDETLEGDSDLASEDMQPVTYEAFIPKTFDEIQEFTASYATPEGIDGILKWDVSDVFYNYFFVGKYMNMGGTSGDDDSVVDIYNDDVINCLKEYQGLNQYYAIDSETSAYSNVLQDFLDGKIIYTIVTTDAVKTISECCEQRKKDAEIAREAADIEKRMGGSINSNAPTDEVAEASTDNKDKSGSDDKSSDSKETEDTRTELEKAADEAEAKVFEFGYACMPNITADLESGSLSVTDTIVVNGYSPNKAAANSFASFISTDYSENLYERTGKVAAAKDAAYKNELSTFVREYNRSIPLCKIVKASNLWVQMEITFTKIWNGGDVESLIKSLADQLNTQISSGESM